MKPRKIDVYCDESYPDLLSSKLSNRQYLVIGGIWIPSQLREKYKHELHALRDQHCIGGEFKWKKVSPSRIVFYRDLVSWFFQKQRDARFRCIIVDSKKLDLEKYHDSDCELGFYKFYYQLLHKWILDDNSYNIFCDFKTNRNAARWKDLNRCLNNANVFAEICHIQAVRSSESVLLQLADVLVGIVAAKFNRSDLMGCKLDLLKHAEELLHHPIYQTNRSEQKFNVFKIRFDDRW